MSRKRLAILGAAALVGSLLVPPNTAGARQSDAEPGGDKSVEVSTSGSYIVVMEDDPLVATIDQDDLTTPAAEAEAAELIETHEDVLEEVGASAGDKVQDYTNALNGFSAIISHDEAEALAGTKGVRLVMPDELRQLETDSSGKYLGLNKGGGAWKSGVTGEGVIVGVIDSGIWPEHPSFADDGTYADPGVVLDETDFAACDFGNTAHNPNDAPFTCNNKLIGARQMLPTYRALIGADPDEFDSARDDDGHGTHTASTAAGNAGVAAEMYGVSLGTVSGIAPRAHVIAYKGLGNLGGFTSDLAASIDQAVFDGVDVINYSVGGGASLTTADDIAFLFAADAGVFVATSAGNSGPGAGTIGGPASVPWITSVGASTQGRFFQGTIHFHGNDTPFWEYPPDLKEDIIGASITPGTDGLVSIVDAEFAGGDLCIPGTLDAAAVAGKIVLCRRGAIGRAEKSYAVSLAGGAGMILYNNTDDDNLFTDTHWVPSVHIDFTPGADLKAWIASTPGPEVMITTGEKSTWESAPSMTIFSSRGSNTVAEDIIKPDVTAPGLQILAGNTPFPDPGNVTGELFQAIAGTSMSSPHVAGLYALIKQVHPDWSAAAAKSAIMTTSDQHVHDNDRVSDADPFDMGAGHIDPGKVNRKGSSFNPGLVYDAGFLDYLGFLCDAEPEALSPTTCPALAGLGVPTDASDLNIASIGIAELAGSQTIVRTVTSVADTTVNWRPVVHAPDGYDVTVSPKRITLAPGASASYTVTITNNGGGAVGEWSFGSLTWRGGGYKAFSPIAVKGALFDAPAAVSAEGASGAGSFDVKFGYSGAYTAAPHGLSADAPTTDTIGQDPDQNYPSADDGLGGVDKITYTVSGSALVRWKLEIPGPDDIDLFLEDVDGNIIAASTNGGTDELIELVLPADGTYTMVVHGWSVPSDPLAYTLQFWDVPATPGGGSLSIDSAPASAVIGNTGTVGYSWTGLAPGVDYVGAVSHSDASGIIGLTLVEGTG
jgi:subtilisin family serine protease